MFWPAIIKGLRFFFRQPPEILARIMGCRYEQLTHLLTGYQQTGKALMYADGSQILPVQAINAPGNADDFGMFILIPKLATFLGLGLPDTIELFFNGLGFVGLVIGLCGFYKLFPNWLSRIISTVGLPLLIMKASFLTDVYRISTILIVALIPWALYFVMQRRRVSIPWYLFLLLAGFTSGCANYIRSHVGTVVLLFIATLVTCYWPQTRKQKLCALSTLICGLVLAHGYFWYQMAPSIAIASTLPKPEQIAEVKHPFWHTVYTGFGFTQNNHGITYQDENTFRHAAAHGFTQPYTAAYEQFLRGEVVQLIRNNPFFVLTTLAAKAGVLLIFFLIFANIGIVADWLYPLAWQIRLAFLLSLGWSSLPGLIAVPGMNGYLYGLICMAAVYNLTAINNAIMQYRAKRLERERS